MFIGNIVTNEKIKEEKYNICNDIKTINSNFPTLIVGWHLVKKIYGEENISIINKKIDDKTYWTFDSKERKVDFEMDLENFSKKCCEFILNKNNYIFLDLIHDNRNKIVKIIKKIYSLDNIITMIIDDMVYLFDENLLFGVDLKILKFMGLDIDKIKRKINQLSKVTLSENQIFNKCMDSLTYNKKIIPYIYRYGTRDKNNHFSIICR